MPIGRGPRQKFLQIKDLTRVMQQATPAYMGRIVVTVHKLAGAVLESRSRSVRGNQEETPLHRRRLRSMMIWASED